MTISLRPEPAPQYERYGTYRRALGRHILEAEGHGCRSLKNILSGLVDLRPSVATRVAFPQMRALEEAPETTHSQRHLIRHVRDDLSFFARISP